MTSSIEFGNIKLTVDPDTGAIIPVAKDGGPAVFDKKPEPPPAPEPVLSAKTLAEQQAGRDALKRHADRAEYYRKLNEVNKKTDEPTAPPAEPKSSDMQVYRPTDHFAQQTNPETGAPAPFKAPQASLRKGKPGFPTAN